jgi:hypothetical protein
VVSTALLLAFVVLGSLRGGFGVFVAGWSAVAAVGLALALLPSTRSWLDG